MTHDSKNTNFDKRVFHSTIPFIIKHTFTNYFIYSISTQYCILAKLQTVLRIHIYFLSCSSLSLSILKFCLCKTIINNKRIKDDFSVIPIIGKLYFLTKCNSYFVTHDSFFYVINEISANMEYNVY